MEIEKIKSIHKAAIQSGIIKAEASAGGCHFLATKKQFKRFTKRLRMMAALEREKGAGHA